MQSLKPVMPVDLISNDDSSLVHDDTATTSIASKKLPAANNGHQSTYVTWSDHAVGIFLYLHPQSYGFNTIKHISKVAEALCVNENTIHHWVSYHPTRILGNLFKSGTLWCTT